MVARCPAALPGTLDADGTETRRTLEANSRPDYRERLEQELKQIADSEMWRAGTVVRSLRPERDGGQ